TAFPSSQRGLLPFRTVALTRQPRSRRTSARCEPTNPVAPVTSAVDMGVIIWLEVRGRDEFCLTETASWRRLIPEIPRLSYDPEGVHLGGSRMLALLATILMGGASEDPGSAAGVAKLAISQGVVNAK